MEKINGFLWGFPGLLLILGVGLRLAFATGWVQLRCFFRAIKGLLGTVKGEERDSFRAFCTALGATVGTGNIVAVAGAITLGGPGSIFWMWACALVGMGTKYAEATLAVAYGGPMNMMVKGLGSRWRPLARCYCLFGCFAAFGMGSGVQIREAVAGIGGGIRVIWGSFPGWLGGILGALFATLAAWAAFGGAKRIGNVCSALVPAAAAGYVVLCLGALVCHRERILPALGSILQGAFRPEAVTGGMVGSWIRTAGTGAARGVFSNEAGMGTAAMAHGTARVAHPAQQGLMGIMEVFVDTMVICTFTALVILTGLPALPYGTDPGAALTLGAFAATYGPWVQVALGIFIALFALSSMLGWGLYSMTCAGYLLGKEWGKRVAVGIVLAAAGAVVLDVGNIWGLSEMFNGLMALPNLLTLWLLCPRVRELTEEYEKGSAGGRSRWISLSAAGKGEG